MQIGVANATFMALVVFSSAVHASSTTARAIRGRPPCENVVVDSKSHERVLRFHESVSDVSKTRCHSLHVALFLMQNVNQISDLFTRHV